MSETPTVAQAQLDQHYPVHQPETPRQDWDEFVGRTAARERDRPPVEHRTVDLANRTPEEQEFFKKVGIEAKAKEATDEKTDVKPEEVVDEKQTSKTETAETRQAGKPESEQAQTKQPRTGYDHILERASKEPDFERVVERLTEPFFPMSQDGYARYQVLDFALTQVPNGLDVIYFLARPENSSLALKMQDAPPHKIAQIAHMISAELRFGSRTKKSSNEEQPRPRAPKPPAEVGGRGAQPDDAALAAARNGDFTAFSAEMDRRARNSR